MGKIGQGSFADGHGADAIGQAKVCRRDDATGRVQVSDSDDNAGQTEEVALHSAAAAPPAATQL